MEQMTWSIETSPPGKTPIIISEYLLNELGVFVKREKRVSKKAAFTALTGFRVGYAKVSGTDYRSAPLDRNVILWHKITSIVEEGDDGLIIGGNRTNEIILKFPPEDRDAVVAYIKAQTSHNPLDAKADYLAASWICWQEDDEWDDPSLPLAIMVEKEKGVERFIEPEVLAQTELQI